MGDSINVDWGAQPLVASPYNAFMKGMAMSRTMNLMKEEDEARRNALANPNDINAITQLAVYNPQAAAPLQQQLVNQQSAKTYSALQAPSIAMPAAGVPAAPQLAPSGLPAVGPNTSFDQAFAPGTAAALAAPPPSGTPQPDNTPLAVQRAQQGMDPAALIDPASPHMQAIGAAASQGTLTPQSAVAALMSVGGPGAVSAVTSAIGNMDDVRRAKLAEMNNALGTAAQSLLNVPQSQRAQMLQQMAPQLAAHGVTTDQINQAIAQGLSDQQLHGFVGQAIGVTGLIDQANKDRQFGIDQQRVGIEQGHLAVAQGQLSEEQKQNAWERSKGIINPSTGGLINPVTGQPIVPLPTDATGIAGAIARVEGQGKNPASSAQGYGQFTNGTFVDTFRKTFPDQASLSDQQILAKRGSGVEQQMLESLTQQNQAALSQAGVTPDAPNTYLAHFLGVGGAVKVLQTNSGTPVKSILPANVIRANPFLANMTAGDLRSWAAQKMQFGAAGDNPAASGGMTKEALQDMADWSIQHGYQPYPNLRGTAQQTAFQNARAQRMKELGLTMDQVINKGQDRVAAGKTLNSFTSGKDSQTVQALNNVTEHLGTLGMLTDALNNGDNQTWNKVANQWATWTGKAAPTNFAAAKQIIGGEIVKAIAGAGGGQGDREEAARVLSAASSPEQLKGAIATIKALIQSQVHTLGLKYQVGTGRNDFAKFLSPMARASFDLGGSGNGPASNAPSYTASNW